MPFSRPCGVMLLSLFLVFGNKAAAQDTQLWTALFANGPVKDDSKVLLWFDGHARYSEDVTRLGVSILRPGIGYKLNQRISVWVGYANVISRADGRDNITDNRIWQQATYTLANGEWGSFSGRTRLEQRFLNTGNDTGFRLRQFFRYAKPIPDTKWTLTGWNEVFIHLNDTDFGANAGFDQSRTFLGLRYKPTNKIALEGGYLLNQIGIQNAGDQFNHNVSISISTSF